MSKTNFKQYWYHLYSFSGWEKPSAHYHRPCDNSKSKTPIPLWWINTDCSFLSPWFPSDIGLKETVDKFYDEKTNILLGVVLKNGSSCKKCWKMNQIQIWFNHCQGFYHLSYLQKFEPSNSYKYLFFAS